MKKVLVGGVPEHFNLPWILAIEEGLFEKEGINLEWLNFPAGTGALSDALRAEEIDLAVILTEGIVKDINEGNPSKIIQVYVESPLLWGIHVAANSTYQSVDQLKGTAAAISRYGSGSHLMAIVNAEKYDWNLDEDLNFQLIEDLQGALESLPKGKGDYFMWEKFMTKPFVDDGTFRLIGETPTPWPSFVIVARDNFLLSQKNTIRTILDIINSQTQIFKNRQGIEMLISERFDQKEADVKNWLALTQWSQQQLSENDLEKVQNKLLKLDLIPSKKPARHFIQKL